MKEEKMERIKYLVLLVLCVFTFTVSGCGKKPAKCEHTSSNWIIDKQATCTEKGSIHKECTVCHEKIITDEIEALGHDLEHHEKQDPTCTEKGHKAYDTCTRCSYTTYEELASLGHDLEHHEKKDPTCTEKGYKAYDTCTRCSYTTYEELASLEHTESNWIIGKEATCTNQGFKYTECTKCHEKLETE